MKIVFNGLLEKRTSGCNCNGVITEVGFTTSKMYILPSGQTRTFTVGRVEEVNKQDADFLLSYMYKDANGAYREVFSKVE